MPWSWHSAKLGNGLAPLFSALPSAVTIALGKLTKTSFCIHFLHSITTNTNYHIYLTSIQTYITYLSHPSHISHSSQYITYITYINPNIYHIYHSYPNIPLVHDKYIRNPSPSEQQMQIQLMLLITKVETECLMKEKLDQSEAHELDYLNPPTEAAQRRRDCMR